MVSRVAAPEGSAVAGEGNGGAVTKTGFWSLTVGSVGVVYGDIGTSPLYAFREAVIASTGDGLVEREVVLGVLSLIVWALIMVVTIKYVIVLLRADNNGEGGTLSLMALATRALGRRTNVLMVLGIIGAAMFLGDSHDHAGHLGAFGGGRPEARHAGVRSLRRAAGNRDPGGAVHGAEPWHGASREPVWPDHAGLVSGHCGGRSCFTSATIPVCCWR